LRRRPASGGAAARKPTPLVYRVLGTAGRPLPAPVATEFGSQLGADLSDVRIHDDSDADRSARSVSAKAYAVGSHLVFRAGGFRPDRVEGRELLAHELAHAVREGGPPLTGGRLTVGSPDDAEEREADRLARQGRGTDSEAAGTTGEVLRRQPDEPEDTAAEDRWADYDLSRTGGRGCDDELIEEYCPLDLDENPPVLKGADARVGEFVQTSCREIHESGDAATRSKARRRVLLAGESPPDLFTDDAEARAWWSDIAEAADTEEKALVALGKEFLVQVPSAFPATAARAYRTRSTLRVDLATLRTQQDEARRVVREAGITMGIYLQGQGMPKRGTPPPMFLGQAGDQLLWPHYVQSQGVVGDLARAVLRYRATMGPSRFVQEYNQRVENEAADIERGEACPPEYILRDADLGPRATISLSAGDAWAVLRAELAGDSGGLLAGLNEATVATLLTLRQLAMSPEDHEGTATHLEARRVADERIAGESGIERLFDAIDIAAYQGYFGQAKDDLVTALKENWETLLLVAGITIGVSLIPVIGWIIGGALIAVGVASTVIDVAKAIRRCLNATTLTELQAGAWDIAKAAVSAGVDVLLGAVTWGAGRAWRAVRGAKRGATPGTPPPRPGAPAARGPLGIIDEVGQLGRAASRQKIAELTPAELDAELSVLARSRKAGPVGAREEVALPNRHEYRTDEGLVWCRHSIDGGCLVPAMKGAAAKAPADRVLSAVQDARYERIWNVLDEHALDWTHVFRDRAEVESFLGRFADNDTALLELERRVAGVVDRHGALAEKTGVAGVKRTKGMSEFDEALTGAQLRAVESGPAVGGTNLPDLGADWLFGTQARMVSRIPGQIARRMRSITFRNWRDFRETFWRMVAQDPQLSQRFSTSNLARMAQGRAPFVVGVEAVGGRANAVYQINHTRPLEQGGSVFDLDYLEVVTPRVHQALGGQ
jgi:hypothetical protein